MDLLLRMLLLLPPVDVVGLKWLLPLLEKARVAVVHALAVSGDVPLLASPAADPTEDEPFPKSS